jgi:EmrB/QacA subfamily drug resistance transporter
MSGPSMSGVGVAQAPPGRPVRTPATAPDHHARRWWILATVAIAQLMVVLDNTIVNIALPSAQHDLAFSNNNRQWVITAYALAFGSLLLLGGRLSDIFGRKAAFVTGLIGFAAASAVGGASVNFGMLVASRAAQGVFGAMLAPAALAVLTTTFTDGRERGKAFGIFGAIAGGGAAVGLLLGGVLTEYLSWRWCLYVNLAFAVLALIGAAILLGHQSRPARRPSIDLPGTALISAALFCLVFGLANAETNSWSSPSAWGFLIAAAPLLVGFVFVQTRVAHPLLPLRIVLDRNRGGAFLAIMLLGVGMFGVFLFLTYFLQQTLQFTPVGTGIAFLPVVAGIMTTATTSTTLLLPRVGPRPLVPVGLAAAAGGLFWLTFLKVDSGYAGHVLPPLILFGLGIGLAMAPSINTATRGVRPADAGVASAMVSTFQQVGGSVGTALLSSIAGTAASDYLSSRRPTAGVLAEATVHGYTTAFSWGTAIFVVGAIVTAAVLKSGAPPAVTVHAPPARSTGVQPVQDRLLPALALIALARQIEQDGDSSLHLIRATARLAPHGGTTDAARARYAARHVLRPLAARILIDMVNRSQAAAGPSGPARTGPVNVAPPTAPTSPGSMALSE